MRNLFILLICFSSINAFAQHGGSEQFDTARINTNYRFDHPFDMFMDPNNDSLWINTRTGRVYKVHKINGGRRTMLDLASQVTLTFNGSRDNISQDGMLGMALHPDATLGLGKDSFYVAFCYNGAAARKVKIRSYHYNPTTKVLSNPTDILTDLPGSNDHNGGRLVFGPDKKIYYSCGDQGANAWGDYCKEIQSQKDISASELSANNYTKYAGHILRINPNGTIPSDNPTINGVKSHIYSKGHRNPQGLSFEKNNNGTLKASGKLFESEQGPVTDDEINIIESGKNYGWPYIAGKYETTGPYRYRPFYKLSPCSGNLGSECRDATALTGDTTEAMAVAQYGSTTFTDAIATTNASSNPVDCTNSSGGNLNNRPTVAWSSIEYYQSNIGIPSWSNSVLLTSLKYGNIIRYKLNASNTGIQDIGTTNDTFLIRSNVTGFYRRPRDLAIDFGNGGDIYVINDSAGKSSGPSGDITLTDYYRGSLIRYRFVGSLLSLPKPSAPINEVRNDLVTTYPNPAVNNVIINTRDLSYRPYTAKLMDINGRIVLTTIIKNEIENLNVQHLRTGHYVLQLINRNGVVIANKKIIIAK